MFRRLFINTSTGMEIFILPTDWSYSRRVLKPIQRIQGRCILFPPKNSPLPLLTKIPKSQYGEPWGSVENYGLEMLTAGIPAADGIGRRMEEIKKLIK